LAYSASRKSRSPATQGSRQPRNHGKNQANGALQPDGDRMVTDIWLSWVVPLFATIVIQSLVAMRRRPNLLAPALAEDIP